MIEALESITREAGRSLVSTPVFVGTRQTTLFVAVRSGGHCVEGFVDDPAVQCVIDLG